MLILGLAIGTLKVLFNAAFGCLKRTTGLVVITSAATETWNWGAVPYCRCHTGSWDSFLADAHSGPMLLARHSHLTSAMLASNNHVGTSSQSSSRFRSHPWGVFRQRQSEGFNIVTSKLFRNNHRCVRPWRRLAPLVSVVLVAAGCSGSAILYGTLPLPDGSAGSLDLAVAVVQPGGSVTASLGAEAVIQWADMASEFGTTVRVTAQRKNALGEDVDEPIELVGDGTPGSGRDALADGDSDLFIWDITGVRIGDYVVTVTIEAPDGTTATAVSQDEDRGTTGVLTIITALEVPTLAFSAPGVADETVTVGDVFNIAWDDNGDVNAEAMLVLGLDTDDDHESGNEIILLQDEPLSNNSANGQFTFAFIDAEGGTVPFDTYTIFAILDDNANHPVTEEAVGRLIVAP